MTSVRRHRITNEEWEHHKPAIKKLYLDERSSLEGENGVINIMRSRHDFSARQVHLIVARSVTDDVSARRNMRLDSRDGASARTSAGRTGMLLVMLWRSERAQGSRV
jgi:hypothetical protein